MNSTYTRKKIENYSYGLNDVIGKGYSSQVYKGRNDQTSQSVAVKVIDLKMLKNQINKVLLQSQIQILKELKSQPNILMLHEVYTTKNNTYIITQLCDSDLNKNIKKKLSQPEAYNYMSQIINGYLNFANKDIIHRDLKPANILITDNNQLKIADFGFAIKVSEAGKSNKYNVGSPLYMAPQSLKKNQYSLKSDIWALGVIFFEMLTTETPWKAKNEKQLIRKIQSEKIDDLVVKLNISSMSKQFLKKCLKVDKNYRLEPNNLTDFNFDVANGNILMEKKLNFNFKGSTDYVNQIHNPSIFSPKIQKSLENRLNFQKSVENRLNSKQLSEKKFNTFRYDSNNQSLQLKANLNHKYSPSVNLDLKKKESQNDHKQNPELLPRNIAVNTQNKSNLLDHKADKKSVSKILISEIHFCRFLYKLLSRITQSKKEGLMRQIDEINVEGIIYDYVGIIKHKIDNLMAFKSVNYINASYYSQYKQTSDYQKLMKISKQYKDRYYGELKSYWAASECNFDTQNTYKLIKNLYLSLEESVEGMRNPELQIKAYSRDIIILDYLITSKQLIEIFQNGQNYEKFARKSRIEQIVEGKTADISFGLYQKIISRAKEVLEPKNISAFELQREERGILMVV